MLRLLVLGASVLLLCGLSAAEEGQPVNKETVGKLLMDAGNDGEPEAQWAAIERLRSIGWTRLEGHIDLRVQRHARQRWAIHDGVFDLAEGEGIYRLALHCMQVGDEEGDDDLALTGISNLERALDERRLRWRSAWWPDLLRELHRTEPVIVEFYSGPGFPAWALRDLLAGRVHGEEQALIEASRHREWRIRMMALPFLAATTTGRTPAVREALRLALRDRVGRVRRAAILACWVGEWSDLAPEVAERLASERESETVRREAARLLGEWCEDSELGEPTSADLEGLFIRVIRGKWPAAAAAAAEHAGRLPRTEKIARTLLHALQSGEPALRAGAARGLLSGDSERMLPAVVAVDLDALIRRVDDPSIPVRRCAIELLAELGRVSVALAPRLIRRLRSDDAGDARSAALALATLRERGAPFLELLRQEKLHAHPEIRHELAVAIEAIEMSILHVEGVEEGLASTDRDVRLAAIRELVRRDDRPRLRAALSHDDPDVAVHAANALAPHDDHTGEVLDTLVRVCGKEKSYLAFSVFRTLEPHLAPHADRLIKMLARTRLDRLFQLLGTSTTLGPSVAVLAWEDFVRSPRQEQAVRVAALHEHLLPKVLGTLTGEDERLRRGAVLVLEHLSRYMQDARWSEVEAALERLPADDLTRREVDGTMEKLGVGRFRPPHSIWIEIR